MLDSGATGNFLDLTLAKDLGIPLIKKKLPEPVRAVDGSELSSGLITHQTSDLILVCDNGHTEQLDFDLIDTPLFGAILGVPWLQLHNPVIDWQKGSVTLNSSRCVHSCYPEATDVVTPLFCSLTKSDTSKSFILPDLYLDFQDVFNEVEATNLPPHRNFDCRVDLVPGAILPCSRIYALTEQENRSKSVV